MEREWTSDCQQCMGLCCVALPYMESADFPSDKPIGEPCVHLSTMNHCAIHDSLRTCGYKAVSPMSALGQGQYVSQTLYAKQSWRENPHLSKEMFAVFPVVQRVHEMIVYLNEAIAVAGDVLVEELLSLKQALMERTEQMPNAIMQIDIDRFHGQVGQLLNEVSVAYRKSFKQKPLATDLIGKKLKGASLRGASFRGKWLMAANLKGADLREVDFLGADLRDAQLHGANMKDALFLTQSQVNGAVGNKETILPSG
ncbi:LOW QUALITY PROTEIN: oxetanocin A resistance protein [Bacillus sp. JCM 19047]|nr:LOW QUALITY PROTEIN: oxetanocin A resistance protein [Bacillus sp. JCM 19047]